MKLLATIILTLVTVNFAAADTVMTDAFGIYTTAPEQEARSFWAGYSENISGLEPLGKKAQAGAVQDVLFFLGPKNLVAGGHKGQAMALVLDAAGNLVADGAAVKMTTGQNIAEAPTNSGIASVFYQPGTLAGQFHAGATVKAQQSNRAEYQVVPDLTGIVPIWAQKSISQALFENYADLKTAPLSDRFGNEILEGAGGQVQLAHGNGLITLLPFVTVQGVGQARLLTRDIPGGGQINLNFERRTSQLLGFEIDFPESAGLLQIRAMNDAETASTKLQLGPFLTTEGHALNDGTTVQVQVTTSSGKVLQESGWILNGLLSITLLVDSQAFPLTVEATSPLGTASHVLIAPEKQVTP
jgi:hypothetical protein